jgi:hypothetical protein
MTWDSFVDDDHEHGMKADLWKTLAQMWEGGYCIVSESV